MKQTDTYDVAIVGGGIGALSAGLFAAASGLRTVIITEIVLGGQLINLEEVVRFPGITEPISGSELASRIETQAIEAGAEFVFDDVTALSAQDDGFLVTGLSVQVRARTVIAATGATRRRLGLTGEDGLEGRGVSYCGTCDGPFFKEKAVIVVGDTDFAGREALVVARYASEVAIVSASDGPRLSPGTRAAIDADERIEVLAGSEVSALVEDDGLLGSVSIRRRKDGVVFDRAVSGLFVNNGLRPNSDLLRPLLMLAPDDSVPVDEGMGTTVPGLFAVGELRSAFPGYAVTAASDGATAAASAYEHLRVATSTG